VTFTPRNAGDGKFNDQQVHGVRLVPVSTDYDAPRAAVAMLIETYRQSGDEWSWREAHFDRLAGTDELRLGIMAGADLDELTTDWAHQAELFEALRDPYLLYR
jgi:uncharacterized protein YbbC (DUF1343 family)